MITQLSTVKSRLALTDYDAILTSDMRFVSDRFDTYVRELR